MSTVETNELDQLKIENLGLRKALENLQDQLKKYEEVKEVEKNIKILNSDYNSIKGIFEIHDNDKKGYLGLNELSKLHESLGEPLTYEESQVAMKKIDVNNVGKIYLGFLLFNQRRICCFLGKNSSRWYKIKRHTNQIQDGGLKNYE
jgi:hypothetical protein